MKTIFTAGWLACALAWFAAAEDGPQLPSPQKEHEWFRQLEGNWETEGEIPTGEGKPPEATKGTASGRLVGGFWGVLEHKGEVMGTPFTGILTLGYDPEKKSYIGTWVDSMTSRLWQYTGTMDKTGKILTLETEGPDFEKPDAIVKFRESLEIVDADHLKFTSTCAKDGAWVTIITIRYSRKK
ncbi:MAG: DUF1579 domain-containing protein [Planctomycetes bacterium]|nr:DUF1579 domain-containing protein [Planctomycetota bacterium]